MPEYLAIQIDQNADFNKVITVRDANRLVQNLVSATANAAMKKSFYATTSNTITANVSDGANGLLTLSLTGAESANLTPGRYVYDVLVTYPGGEKQRVVEGVVVVNHGIST